LAFASSELEQRHGRALAMRLGSLEGAKEIRRAGVGVGVGGVPLV